MDKLEKITIKVTEWVGTPLSILIHTIFFIGIFALGIFGVDLQSILLILTTAVSLEAIYLAIFIQMSVNRSNQTIQGIEKDVDEIQADVGEIQEDVEELQEDVEDIGESVVDEEVQKVAVKPALESISRLSKLESEIAEIKDIIKIINNKLK